MNEYFDWGDLDESIKQFDSTWGQPCLPWLNNIWGINIRLSQQMFDLFTNVQN